jgi:hypothetical protein
MMLYVLIDGRGLVQPVAQAMAEQAWGGRLCTVTIIGRLTDRRVGIFLVDHPLSGDRRLGTTTVRSKRQRHRIGARAFNRTTH